MSPILARSAVIGIGEFKCTSEICLGPTYVYAYVIILTKIWKF